MSLKPSWVSVIGFAKHLGLHLTPGRKLLSLFGFFSENQRAVNITTDRKSKNNCEKTKGFFLILSFEGHQRAIHTNSEWMLPNKLLFCTGYINIFFMTRIV